MTLYVVRLIEKVVQSYEHNQAEPHRKSVLLHVTALKPSALITRLADCYSEPVYKAIDDFHVSYTMEKLGELVDQAIDKDIVVQLVNFVFIQEHVVRASEPRRHSVGG